MKICTNNIGEFIVELSDGKAYKITERDGKHLYNREYHPKHYLVISTLQDLESGQRPDIWLDDNLKHRHYTELWFEPFEEGYEQGEY